MSLARYLPMSNYRKIRVTVYISAVLVARDTSHTQNTISFDVTMYCTLKKKDVDVTNLQERITSWKYDT